MVAAQLWALLLLLCANEAVSLPTAERLHKRLPIRPPVDAHLRKYVTRPDLTPPNFQVKALPPFKRSELKKKPWSLFWTPHGPGEGEQAAVITRADGEPVWISHDENLFFAAHPVEYQGAPHLVYWAGAFEDDHDFGRSSTGYGILLDQHYRKVANISSVDSRGPNLHEMEITPQGTALMTIQRRNYQHINGEEFRIREDYIQEVDVETGRLVFNFSTSDNIDARESFVGLHEKENIYFIDTSHVNAVSKTSKGKIIISARHLHAIIAIDPDTGKILWQVGGKHSDYTFDPPSARFRWQHDGRIAEIDGQDYITVFDNGNDGTHDGLNPTRGLILHLDHQKKVARLVGEYTDPSFGHSGSQGSIRILDDGDVFVGSGVTARAALFTFEGQIKFKYNNFIESYRSVPGIWHGAMPLTLPDMAIKIRPDLKPGRSVYLSWNGATLLSSWALFGANDPEELQFLATSSHDSFETRIDLEPRSTFEWILAVALDKDNQPLNSTYLTSVQQGTMPVPPSFDLHAAVFDAFVATGAVETKLPLYAAEFTVYIGDGHDKRLSGLSTGTMAFMAVGFAGFMIYIRRKSDPSASQF